MSKKKRKVPRLTEEQYNAYIATLKENAALYNADGKLLVPSEIDVRKPERKKGD